MQTFHYDSEWLNHLLPQGMVVPSSTLISGEGGSGKPLIGFTIISSWLKQGGNVIFLLTSTGKDFVDQTFREVYGLNIGDFKKQLRFVQLDPDMPVNAEPTPFDSWSTPSRVNLVNPENWDKAIAQAEKQWKGSDGPGTLVFGAALNLMLFSKTYGDAVLDKFEKMTRDDKTRSYLFTVSTSALADKIEVLEKAADNLMFTRNEKPMKLFLRIERMKAKPFDDNEVEVPLSQQDLQTIKKLAEGSRSNLIPKIRKI